MIHRFRETTSHLFTSFKSTYKETIENFQPSFLFHFLRQLSLPGQFFWSATVLFRLIPYSTAEKAMNYFSAHVENEFGQYGLEINHGIEETNKILAMIEDPLLGHCGIIDFHNQTDGGEYMKIGGWGCDYYNNINLWQNQKYRSQNLIQECLINAVNRSIFKLAETFDWYCYSESPSLTTGTTGIFSTPTNNDHHSNYTLMNDPWFIAGFVLTATSLCVLSGSLLYLIIAKKRSRNDVNGINEETQEVLGDGQQLLGDDDFEHLPQHLVLEN